MKEVLLLNRFGNWNENSRFRFYQFFPELKKNQIIVKDRPFYSDSSESSYLQKDKINFFKTSSAFLRRSFDLLFKEQSDYIWIESELFPYIPFGLENLLIKLDKIVILDLNDSHFLRYSSSRNPSSLLLKWKIPYWLQRADQVLVSSPYVRDFAQKWNPKAIMIPPAIDLTPYPKREIRAIGNDNVKEFKIGWTGSGFTSRFLRMIYEPLQELKRVFPIKLVVMGGDRNINPPVPTEFLDWDPGSEFRFMDSIDIGIQPLPHSLREMGHPSIRILKYMANYKPIISSPMGSANLFIRHNENGFLAKNEDDWYLALRLLLEDEQLRISMGKKSREIVEQEFTLQKAAPRLSQIF